MVTSISTMYLQISLLLLCLLSSSRNPYAEQVFSVSRHSDSYVVPVSYLLPSNFCNPSPKVFGKESFEVVNKYGPCSKHNQGKASALTFSQIRRQDEARINYILSRRRSSLKQAQEFTVPTTPGPSIGTGNYFIKVGLGTPKQEFAITIDTGSPYTWTQCRPCTNGCFQQVDPIFDPTKSKTYRRIPCSSSICKQIEGSSCSSDSKSCLYSFGYVDGSGVGGSFAKETLTINSADSKSALSVPDYVFLCAYNVTAEGFEGTAGIMGLDRHPQSFVSQTSNLHKNYFSYCLPSFLGYSNGYITFGKTDDYTNKIVKFTPLTPTSTEFYDIEITGLSVAGKKLPIPSSVFKQGETSIDSGTVITRLQTPAYKALRSAFRKKMSKYKMVKPSDDLSDTCYDFSGYDKVEIPKVSIFFKGGVELEVGVRGIMFPNKVNEVCLAFAGNGNLQTSDVLIGNYQQQGIEVHYDVAGRQIGFGARGC